MQVHFDSLDALERYLKNLDSIDVPYYAAINGKKGQSKAIVFPLDDGGNIHLGFTEAEFEEMKSIIRNYASRERTVDSMCYGFTSARHKGNVCPS
jgi:hypothetical protein